MKRREFLNSTISGTTALSLPQFLSVASEPGNFSVTGHSFWVDHQGTAHLLTHDAAQDLFVKHKLFHHGAVIDAVQNVTYDKNQLLFSAFAHPKRNSSLLFYFEFCARQKKLLKYHFLNLNCSILSSEFIGSFNTNSSHNDLSGEEKILLLLDHNQEHQVAAFLMQDHRNIFVGEFYKQGTEIYFQKSGILSEDFSTKLSEAQWNGPYDHLIKDKKNVFIAVHENIGILVFHFYDGRIQIISQIENGQCFGDFVFHFPKLNLDNVEEIRTQFLEVITPYDPDDILFNRDVMMITTPYSAYFLQFNPEYSDFELVSAHRECFTQPLTFTGIHLNPNITTQPDLLLFRDDKSHLFSLLTCEKGVCDFTLRRIPAATVSLDNVFMSIPIKGIIEKQPATKGFHYPLSFVDQKSGISRSFELMIPRSVGAPYAIQCQLKNQRLPPLTMTPEEFDADRKKKIITLTIIALSVALITSLFYNYAATKTLRKISKIYEGNLSQNRQSLNRRIDLDIVTLNITITNTCSLSEKEFGKLFEYLGVLNNHAPNDESSTIHLDILEFRNIAEDFIMNIDEYSSNLARLLDFGKDNFSAPPSNDSTDTEKIFQKHTAFLTEINTIIETLEQDLQKQQAALPPPDENQNDWYLKKRDAVWKLMQNMFGHVAAQNRTLKQKNEHLNILIRLHEQRGRESSLNNQEFCRILDNFKS